MYLFDASATSAYYRNHADPASLGWRDHASTDPRTSMCDDAYPRAVYRAHSANTRLPHARVSESDFSASSTTQLGYIKHHARDR